MTGQEVINKVLDELNLKAPTFAENIGVKYQRIFDLQKGKVKKVSSDVANNIINKYSQFSLSWLLTGEGNMFNEDDIAPKKSDETSEPYRTYLLPMSAMGGPLTGFTSSAMLKDCEAIISPIENVDFAISVYGESMAPEYPSGSRVLIKKINPNIFIDWGKTYVLDTPNGVIIKEIHECKDKPGYIRCHSINPDPKFSDFDVPLNEVYGIYRVLMCLSAK